MQNTGKFGNTVMVCVITAMNWLETLCYMYKDNSEQLEHKLLLVNWNELVEKLVRKQ